VNVKTQPGGCVLVGGLTASVPDGSAIREAGRLCVEEYEKKYQEQQLKYMRKKAAKLGYQLTPA
jgi:hypothetical protein